MLALLAQTNPYLGIEDPNMMMVYLLLVAIAAIGAAMVLFRLLAKAKENRQVRKSSWRTFHKVAKVKGLSKLEIEVLSEVAEKSKVQRPTQMLGSMQFFDRTVDKAADRGIVSDVEQGLLDGVREKLMRSNVKWDGRQTRRQYERAECTFEVEVFLVTKNAIDEELKSSYDDSDPKFIKTIEGLVAESTSVGARVMDLSAGGLAVLMQDNGIKEGDYINLESGVDPAPFAIAGMTREWKTNGRWCCT